MLISLSAGQFFPDVLFHSLRLHALKVNYKNITLLVTKDLPRTFGWAQYISTTGTKVLSSEEIIFRNVLNTVSLGSGASVVITMKFPKIR